MDWVRQSLGSDWKAFENVLKTALDSPYALLSVLMNTFLTSPQTDKAGTLSAAGYAVPDR